MEKKEKEKDKEKEGKKEKWQKLKDLRKSNGNNPIISKLKRSSGTFPSTSGEKENGSKPTNGDTHTTGHADATQGGRKGERSDSVVAAPFGTPSEDKFVRTAVRGKRPRKFNEKTFNTLLEALKSDTFRSASLGLANKHLDKYAAEDLAQALLSNKTVTELDVSNNALGDQGVFQLGLLLMKNATITSLDIRFNQLSRAGPEAFLACLNNNVSLRKLFMEEELGADMNEILHVAVTRDHFAPTVRETAAGLLRSNEHFQLVVQGKSNELDLSNRQQSRINQKILERFTHLRVINFSHNKLKVLPSAIGNVKALEYLDLSYNKLVKLPKELAELRNMKVLNVKKNELSEMPLSLTALTRLRSLNFANNKVEEFPVVSVCNMQSLQEFFVDGNPFVDASRLGGTFRYMVSQGGKETLAFLRENNKGTKKTWRMKLMFVGNGNVGKTTLLDIFLKKNRIDEIKKYAKRKQANPFEFPNVATDGIDIHTWYVEHPNGDDSTFLRYSCWDFAGQDVYYATHGFFLSSRAIYLLVFNLCESLKVSRLEYWLQSINARIGQEAPVIIVGTHADDKRCTTEYIAEVFEKIHKKFGKRFKLRKDCYFAISNVSGAKISKLKKKIVDISLKQEYMPEVIPLSFFELEEKINAARKGLNPPVLKWERYQTIATKCGVSPENVLTVTRYLHDNGSLCYFGDNAKKDDKSNALMANRKDKFAGLDEIVIVDPQWITKTFATIISLKFDFIKNGVLDCSFLPQLWRPPSYPLELHDRLVSLLEKFEVISRITHRDTPSILIPCLLPEMKPNAPEIQAFWPTNYSSRNQVGRVFKIQFVPNGFFSRLIVRFLSSDYEPRLYWKRGIIMSKGSETIKLEIDEREVEGFGVSMELWIRGERLGLHLLRFIEYIETLIQDWLVVPYEATIPCTKCKAEDMTPVYQFPIDDVEKCIREFQETIKCGHQHSLAVAKLAPDISLDDFERIPYSAIETGELLGEGAFAKAYKGKWKDQIVAVKELNLGGQSIIPRNIFQELRKEASIMSELQHKNIVGLLGLCVESKLCIVLEFMALGQLYEYLHNMGNNVTPSMVLKIAKDVAAGMSFMHSHNPPIIHRDLKSPNILLNWETNELGEQVIIAKVSDFGFSRLLLLVDTLKEKPVDNPVWLAPELIKKENYDEKVDTYAYGVILWELVSRSDFFGEIPNLIELEDAILAGKRPAIDASFALQFPEFTKLIRRCWAEAPADRPAFKLVCNILSACEKTEFQGGDTQLRWAIDQNDGDNELCNDTEFHSPSTHGNDSNGGSSKKEEKEGGKKKGRTVNSLIKNQNEVLSPKAAGHLSKKVSPGLWKSGAVPLHVSDEHKILARSPRVKLTDVVNALNLSGTISLDRSQSGNDK